MNAGWSLLVATHAFAATVALVLGGVQLFLPTKGDRLHRHTGRVWVGLMVYVAVTSFWIRDIRAGQLSWLHVLSVVTLVTDVPHSRRAAYVGIDNRAAGATAAYLVTRWAGGTGTVLVTLSR